MKSNAILWLAVCQRVTQHDQRLRVDLKPPIARLEICQTFYTTIFLDKQFYKLKIDTLDALEEHEKHEDDYQTNSNW